MLLRRLIHVMSPIFLAGVLNHQNDLTPPSQGRQSFDHLQWQIRNTKYHNAGRQALGLNGLLLLNLVHELRMHL